MTFEIGGVCRAALIALVVWPHTGSAQTQADPPLEAPTSLAAQSQQETPPSFTAPDFEPLRFGAFSVGGRGVVYRNALHLGPRELPLRVWGGRSHKQMAIGFDFEPVLRHRDLRIGAYGSVREVGLAMRLRY